MHRFIVGAVGVLIASAPMVAHAEPEEEKPVSAPEDAASAPAPAPEPASAPAPASASASASAYPYDADAPMRLRKPRVDRFRFSLGGRGGLVDDPGFDAFAKNDVLGQLSLSGSYTLFARGKLAVSVGGAWDVGSRTSGARGLETKLTVQRLTAPIEGRFLVKPWLHVFAKVAPGAEAFHARVSDPSAPKTLEDVSWVFATDLSAGASLLMFPYGGYERQRARFWLTPEIGYGVTTRGSLRPIADRDDADVLGADARTRLGSLATTGLFWRVAVAVSF